MKESLVIKRKLEDAEQDILVKEEELRKVVAELKRKED